MIACFETEKSSFALKGDEYLVNPSQLSSLTTTLNAKSPSSISKNMGIVSEWASAQGDSFSPTTGNEPEVNESSLGTWLEFGTGDTMTATGRFPDHLATSFTFALVGVFEQTGFKFRLGSDDETESMTISIPGPGQLTTTHSTSSGNLRSRTWSGLPEDGKPHVLVVVFGEATKDMEVYVDGFRSGDYSFSGTGSASSFHMVGRDFKITNTGSENFLLGQVLVFNQKLGPQTVYGISRFLAKDWEITIAGITNKEIRNNQMPSITPENVDANYIYSAILSSKCVTCHRAGTGYSPAFENESLLRAARDSSGHLILNPGDSAASSLFTSVNNNSMPFGGSPLSAAEKQMLKDWIDSGAL